MKALQIRFPFQSAQFTYSADFRPDEVHKSHVPQSPAPLSAEIFRLIARNLLDQHFQRTLANLQITSKALYNIVTPILYRRLRIEMWNSETTLPSLSPDSNGRDRRLIKSALDMWHTGQTWRTNFGTGDSLIYKCLNLLNVRTVLLSNAMQPRVSIKFVQLCKTWNAAWQKEQRRNKGMHDCWLLGKCTRLGILKSPRGPKSVPVLDLKYALGEQKVQCCLQPDGHFANDDKRWTLSIDALFDSINPSAIQTITFHPVQLHESLPIPPLSALRTVRYLYNFNYCPLDCLIRMEERWRHLLSTMSMRSAQDTTVELLFFGLGYAEPPRWPLEYMGVSRGVKTWHEASKQMLQRVQTRSESDATSIKVHLADCDDEGDPSQAHFWRGCEACQRESDLSALDDHRNCSDRDLIGVV